MLNFKKFLVLSESGLQVEKRKNDVCIYRGDEEVLRISTDTLNDHVAFLISYMGLERPYLTNQEIVKKLFPEMIKLINKFDPYKRCTYTLQYQNIDYHNAILPLVKLINKNFGYKIAWEAPKYHSITLMKK